MILALNERLKNKIDQRQVYRDSVVLSTQLSETLAEPLHNLLNAKYILSQQEQTLVRTLQQLMREDNSLLTLNYQLSELMIIYQQITEDVERIGRKMATHFPNLESFMAFSDKNSLALEKGWVIVEALMSQLINSIRPFIFEEYSLDIWEIVSLQIEVTSAPLKETHRLLVIFNRIFDDILFETELEARPFPNIKITITGSEESGQLLINCQVIPSYHPNQFTLYFCQDRLDYYQGKISLNCSDEMTIWQIRLPVD
jgi:adenylate cyclase